jgi:hypothetical protein
VPARSSFDYAIIRVVPRVERQEFMNVGVVLLCRERRFLSARVELDEQRLAAFAPWLDIADVKTHLDALQQIAKGGKDGGPIGELSQAERFHWLVAPRSTIIQPSPVHSGLCDSPQDVLEHLLNTMVRLPQR